ncbi:MAG: T9SS type A sorting domain-containing protein [Bacillota bacterium]
MNKKAWSLLLLLTVFSAYYSVSNAKEKETEKGKQLNKTTTNDYYTYIDINQILMYVANNGDGSHDPRTNNGGFYWPGGLNATKTAIFQDGLIWGGKVGREIRVNGNTHRQGLQAGKILADGRADDPSLAKYRVYKIRKDWALLPPGSERDKYEKDYNEWPVEDGAPWVDVNGDGIYTPGVDQPEFMGDEVLWYVANDLDAGRSTRTYGAQPIGIEEQCTIFAFKRTGDLGDIVFKKYKLINKGQNTIRDMYVGYWSDVDLGSADDDYTGCDTVLSLGYTYNGKNTDKIYGDAPPAVGYDFFQGPIVKGFASDSAKFDGKWRKGYKNLPMTAFTYYINGDPAYADPDQGSATGSIQFYNYLQGYIGLTGNPFIDPNTALPSKFVLSGDPVSGKGWYEGKGFPGGQDPGDRRQLMCSGPFTMAPGDTQEVVVGCIIARGTSNINSVAELKRKDNAAQIAYNLDFSLTPAPESPKLHLQPQDQAVMLWWENNSEKYDERDPLIGDHVTLNLNGKDSIITIDTKNYKFEGYRVWQYKDAAGTDPKLIATYDLKNEIKDVYNFTYNYAKINGQIHPEVLLSAPNDGIRRYLNISQNYYTNGPLYNGTPYYYGITAYGVSKFSDPPFLESTPQIMEVKPTTLKVDYTSTYNSGNLISAHQVQGYSDGLIKFKVIDPTSLTGDKYHVIIKTTATDTTYSLVNVTKSDTLLKNINVRENPADSLAKPVIEGFQVYVYNAGLDSLTSNQTTKYRVKGIFEVKGPNGAELSNPIELRRSLNSTKKWKVVEKGQYKRLNFQRDPKTEGLGYNDYEIRFSGTSNYFLTGYTSGIGDAFYIKATDPKAQSTLPFQVFDLGRNRGANAQEQRLAIKVIDNDPKDTARAIKDGKWTQLPSGDWEELFAFKTPFSPDTAFSGAVTLTDMKFGGFAFSGDQPEAGTVIRISTFKPFANGDVYEAEMTSPNYNDKQAAKDKLAEISVYPNPYFGSNALERDKYQRFVRFTNLPKEVSLRIFSLSGIFIKKIDKTDVSPWLDWDLRNQDGLPVSSGMYIAYLDMPGIGTKVLKIAIIQETQYIDRL